MPYITNGLGTLEGFSGGANGFGNSVAMASIVDGIFTTGSSIELTTGWTVAGLYEHHWTPDWKTSVYGGYVKVMYDDAAAQMYCGYSSSSPRGSASTSSGALGAIVSSCDPNNSFWNVGTRTQWSPNSNLDLGVDFMWNHINTANSGFASLPAQGARPATSGGSLTHQTPPGTTSRTTTCTRWPFARSTTSCRDRLINTIIPAGKACHHLQLPCGGSPRRLPRRGHFRPTKFMKVKSIFTSK